MQKFDENFFRDLCDKALGLKISKKVIVYGGYRLYLSEDSKVRLDQ